MKQFANLHAFARHLEQLAVKEEAALRKGLARGAAALEEAAKAEFGNRQDDIGEFPSWAPAVGADARAQAENQAPLLGSGALRDSISHEVSGLQAAIGSTSKVLVFHELGTDAMAPRPVLGAAALRSREEVQAILAEAAAAGLREGR
jgi:phage gpG-like protein